MITFMLWVFWKIFRLGLLAALVLVYIELGPGGQPLGVFVYGVKDLLVSVDWISLLEDVGVIIQQSTNAFLEAHIQPQSLQACIDTGRGCANKPH